MKERVHLSKDEIASPDDAMFVLARLAYRDLLEFAGNIQGDADKINEAIEDWLLAQKKGEADD